MKRQGSALRQRWPGLYAEFGREAPWFQLAGGGSRAGQAEVRITKYEVRSGSAEAASETFINSLQFTMKARNMGYINDTENTQQGSCCGKLKFSTILKLLDNDGIEMDDPGILMAFDREKTASCASLGTLEADSLFGISLSLSHAGLSALGSAAMRSEPEALATVAKWFGRHHKKQGLISFMKDVFND